MNNNEDDLIGFIVVANENMIIGITIDSGIFILFRYQNGKPLGSQTL